LNESCHRWHSNDSESIFSFGDENSSAIPKELEESTIVNFGHAHMSSEKKYMVAGHAGDRLGKFLLAIAHVND